MNSGPLFLLQSWREARIIAGMTAESLFGPFAQLSTPLIADAALRLKIPFRIAPAGIRPVSPGQRVAGPALPVRHFGSVDVFLEAMQDAQPGDVLVIDNGGRLGRLHRRFDRT